MKIVTLAIAIIAVNVGMTTDVSQIGTTSMDRAISVCSNAAERKAGRDARTSEITAVAKDGNGWRVEGQLSGASESNFLCGATNDRVDFVQLGNGDLAFAN